MWLLLWLGCGGSEPTASTRTAHATEWDALKAAAARGDVDTLHVLARDVTLGNVDENHPSANNLGAALGFLQVAEDPDDIDSAILRAEAACASCHAERGVRTERTPPEQASKQIR